MYRGEKGRRFGAREKEHHKDVDSVGEKKFTKERRKESVEEYHPSAFTDHVAQSNPTIDLAGVKLPTESHWKIRGIKEAVPICKTGPHTMNWDGGCHQLPDVYTHLFATAPPGCARQQ